MRRLFFLSFVFVVGVFFGGLFFANNALAAEICDLCQISGGECPPELYDSAGTCDTGMGFNGTCCVLKSGSGGSSGNDCPGGLCINDACPSNFPDPVKTCKTTNGMTGTCCMPLGSGGGTGGTGGGGDCVADGGSCNPSGSCTSGSPSPSRRCPAAGAMCCMPVGGGGGGTGGGGEETGGAPTGPTCPGYWKAGICFPATTGLSNVPVYVILYNLVWWLLAIVGFIGIIAFTISGMQYLLSAGNEEMAKTAKNSMKYSIIGMVVALSGLVIIFAIDMALRAIPYF